MSSASAAVGLDRLMATELAADIEFLSARSRSIGTSRANKRLKPLGLRVRSYSVLALAASGAGPTQRQLAEFLRLDPSQIVTLLDELEAEGLLRREPDRKDRRTKVIVATEKGERVHHDAAIAVRRAQDESLAALTAGERAQLQKLLSKVAFAPIEGDA